MPTFEVKTPVGANQIWMKQQIKSAVAEATRRGKLRPELGRFAHRREHRQQPRAGHADHPLRAVGARRHRGEADSQGRRLREHERAVFAADRAAASRAAPIARSKACASASCTRCGTRRARAARPARSASASAAIARPATCTRRSSCSARIDDVNPDPRLAELEAEIMRTVNTLGVGTMGFGGRVSLIGCKIGALNRLPASFFVSVAYDCWAFRRLGVDLDAHERRDHAVALSRSRDRDDSDDGPGRLPAHRPRSGADHAARRGDGSIAQGRRRRDGQRPRLHRPRRRAPSPREPCAAGRSARRRDLSLRSGRREGRRWLARHGGRARPPAFARSRIRATSSASTACAR